MEDGGILEDLMEGLKDQEEEEDDCLVGPALTVLWLHRMLLVMQAGPSNFVLWRVRMVEMMVLVDTLKVVMRVMVTLVEVTLTGVWRWEIVTCLWCRED